MFSIPRWLSRIGAGLGVAIAVGVVATPPVIAAPENPYGFIIVQDAFRIGAVGAGGSVIAPAVQGHLLENARLSIDVADLKGVATAEFSDECTVQGTVATCGLPDDDDLWVTIPVFLKGTAAAGASGGITFTLTADNLAAQTTKAKIALADGVDFVFVGGAEPTTAEPGDTFDTPAAFFNNGTETAHGAQLWISTTRGVDFPQYEDCVYEDRTAICDISEDFAPGEGYEIVGGLPVTIKAMAYQSESVAMAVFPVSDVAAVAKRFKAHAKQGTGKKLPVRKITKSAARVAAPDDDYFPDDNYGGAHWNVANHYDVEALGASATGAVGDEVKVKVGAKNHGPAWLAGDRSGAFGAIITKLTVPPGASVVGAIPDNCYGLGTEDGHPVQLYNEPGLPEYFCSGPALLPGDVTEHEFTLKITEVIVDAKGTVAPFRPTSPTDAEGTLDGDSNAANNTASLVLNPTPGGGGGEGGGGGLPITGAKTGAAVGVGLTLVVAGAATYVMTRRRRIMLMTPE